MKIAIPSNNNINISRHFGRTKGFVICEIENDTIIKKEYTQNTFTGHAQGLHSDHDHNHEHGQGNHSHDGIFNAIGDCKIVIAGGMGRKLYNDFEQKNIKVFVTKEKNIDSALNLFLNSELDNNSDSCCSH
ncbi:MAG: NifB/NifX family molybdenum-iron cluster-binding protein [Flavobacteriaceae bacterium]|nr:NifB/NifX family molybdenum-iron cluster-binding protein [Flavobacteriaceae bacterium]